eukprot:scaffold4308_cov110-Cylindrotheca_fusiformis.AAC.2
MDDCSGFSLLDDGQVTLIAEVLSYVLESTQDLAMLRRVSKRWNSSVLPYCIRNGCVLKNCGVPQSPKFVEELVKVGEKSYAGRLYRFPQDMRIFQFWVQKEGTSPASVATDTMLMIADREWNSSQSVRATEKEEDYSFVSNEGQQRTFAEYCKTLTETKSWETFQRIGKKAIEEGMFVCVEDLEKAKRESLSILLAEGTVKISCIPVILTVSVPVEQVQLLETSGGDKGSSKVALLTAKSPKGETGEETFPFLNGWTKNNPALAKEREEEFLYPTLAGYNVSEEDGIITCQVPTAFFLKQDLYEFMWESRTESHLPLDVLWSKCQERHVREGVAIADGVVPKALHDELMSQIDAFMKNQAIVDYHPHSNDIVRDIVHPAIYSYVKGVSPLLKSEEDIRSLPSLSGPSGEEKPSGIDYWGRPYEASAKYQWLPTYFEIGEDGNCTICDYINNIVPRAKHEDLYSSLGQLFSQALPLIESVYSYCRVVKEHHLRIDEEEELDYNDAPIEEIEEVPVSLRGKQVQVVTKIVDYELSPGQTYEGVWHVEGMSHEEIVATAIYFIDRDEEIEGGNILFKRAFHKKEAEYIFSAVDQTRPDKLEKIIHEGLHPLGQVETIPGRLLVFPNSHVHKVTKLENVLPAADGDGTTKKKRRIIVFFLINPEQRIVSTRDVPVQQEHAGGSMTWAEACEHRLELMKERKFTKQDWNVREIELCEH